MNVAKPLERKNFAEFEAMPKEEGWNYELTEQKKPQMRIVKRNTHSGLFFYQSG